MSQRLDDSKTAPFTLGPALEDARCAVLLLHGFTGSPWELRPLGEALAARGFLVQLPSPARPRHHARGDGGRRPPRLAGSGRPRRSSRCASTASVFVVGLSMGALLAMVLAARHRAQVQGLVLLAPGAAARGPRRAAAAAAARAAGARLCASVAEEDQHRHRARRGARRVAHSAALPAVARARPLRARRTSPTRPSAASGAPRWSSAR